MDDTPETKTYLTEPPLPRQYLAGLKPPEDPPVSSGVLLLITLSSLCMVLARTTKD